MSQSRRPKALGDPFEKGNSITKRRRGMPRKPKALGDPAGLSIQRGLEELIGKGEIKESTRNGERNFRLTDKGIGSAEHKIRTNPEFCLYFVATCWNISLSEFRKNDDGAGPIFEFAISILRTNAKLAELGIDYSFFLKAFLEKVKKNNTGGATVVDE